MSSGKDLKKHKGAAAGEQHTRSTTDRRAEAQEYARPDFLALETI
jgi:hypothetical protein